MTSETNSAGTAPAPVDETETPPEGTETPPEGTETVERINDPDAMWRSHEKYRHESHSLRRQLDEANTKLEEQRQATLSEQDKAIEEAYNRGKAEGEADWRQKFTQQIVVNRATGKLVDPDDAVRFLDLDSIDIDKADEIDAAIDELIKLKPHLAASRGPRRIDQGPQGSTVTPEETGDDWLRRSARGT